MYRHITCDYNPTGQTKFMAKLAAEKEATLRLKGENGIMKKKFSRLSKSVPYLMSQCTTNPLHCLFCFFSATIREEALKARLGSLSFYYRSPKQ